MRIFISSTDKFRHAPLYEVIVYAAKRYGMAGATVLKGSHGIWRQQFHQFNEVF